MLNGKNILIGVCGSIAAYKAALLVRLLVKAGANVRVIMTPDATAFITPLTLSTLSKNPVLSTLVANEQGEWNNHVDLGYWANAFVIAPITANTLAKLANGLSDNLLTSVYLSARCPVYLAPAMDLDMLAHGSTQKNLDTLRSFGNTIIEPGYGELASGLTGDGRLAEPEEIIEFLEKELGKKADLQGKKILISAGPTYEAIDPVRFIGNHSSGKMGFALAECAAERGAEVVLVSGPSALSHQHPNINRISVTSAQEMYEACTMAFPACSIAIMSAAVADYTPVTVADNKIKKKEDHLTLELAKTKDILKTLGSAKKNGQLVVGFALETTNELAHAQEKLDKKNVDMIVLNSLQDAGAGFGTDTNRISILRKDRTLSEYALLPKKQVANIILDEIIKLSS